MEIADFRAREEWWAILTFGVRRLGIDFLPSIFFLRVDERAFVGTFSSRCSR